MFPLHNLVHFITLIVAQIPSQVNVGLLIVGNQTNSMLSVSYESTASAVLIARDRIIAEQILPGVQLNFVPRIGDCLEMSASHFAVDLMKDDAADVVLGPVCTDSALVVGVIGKYYNCPVITYGESTGASLIDPTRLPTTIVMSANTRSLGVALGAVLSELEWNTFAFLYSSSGETGKCANMRTDLQNALNTSDVEMAVSIYIADISSKGMVSVIEAARKAARIFVICLTDYNGIKRRFMLAAKAAGYVSDEYAYIFADIKSNGFYIPTKDGEAKYIWQATGEPWADGKDNEAFDAFKNVFSLNDMRGLGEIGADAWGTFSTEVIARMGEHPFNCSEGCRDPSYLRAGTYAVQLYDAMLVYAYALNKTLANNASYYKSGTEILKYSAMDFQGLGGRIVVGQGGQRMPTFYFYGLNANGSPQLFGRVMVNGTNSNYSRLYKEEAELFVNYDRKQKPLNEPLCGYTGEKCPPDFVETYLIWIILATAIIVFFILIALSGLYMTVSSRRRALLEQDKLWQIPFSHFTETDKKTKTGQSMRSMTSSKSSIATRATHESKKETRKFKFYVLQNEKVACLKHVARIRLTDAECFELRRTRELEHDNINRFLGLCLDGPELLSVWKYYGRGSLHDVVNKNDSTMDVFFIHCLLRDIIDGLQFLHGSFIKFHGNLTSETCLVDDRFQVKLAYFGLRDIQRYDTKTKEDQLWTAPEILRGENEGSSAGDIFSFAIIASELVTKKPVWDMANRKEPADTIIYWLKRGKRPLVRPELNIHESLEISNSLITLIQDCWDEEENSRPTVAQIRSALRSMNSGGQDNLLDHMLNVMENYAGALEEEVSSRMNELIEEKKKSDLLLYRMLPRSVADKLKLGQSVPPESFDSVTVFFSDVVSFTTLAAKCTPLQVVNLLNDLYSIFDGIINEHDVYKVETIGDGYLCVSGLPKRNGNDHVRQIASMSLGFLRSLITFRIPHLPGERVNLRIGMHTGPVVAGVVGLTMPRFCLFGDTVNTASRMESNGKPGMIHLSPEANHLLTKVIGGFVTEPRGEVIIKGKGVMATYWLLGCSDDSKLVIEKKDIPHSPPPEARSASPEGRLFSSQGLYATFRTKSSASSSRKHK